MRVEYLGTGAAEGIPALFCNCAYCTEARRRGEIRTRSQVLLDGELSIDFPPDAFSHAARAGIDFSAVRYLLVTHAHMDHFYAQDFILRGYKYARGITSPTLDIYGNAEVIEVFREGTAREMRPEVAPSIRLHKIGAFEEITFGEWRVWTVPAQHSSKEPLLFLAEKGERRVLHLADTGALTDEAAGYLETVGGNACDLITLDCTFLYGKTEKGARHMGLDENARTLEKLARIGLADGHTKRVITHFSHNCAPEEALLRRAEREYGVIAAYDGMTLEL